MDEQLEQLHSELRYAERLCQRTARLYRKAATLATFLSVAGGSAVLGALSEQMPAALSLAGAALLVVATALNVAVRPAEKATVADADMRRYSKLRALAAKMTADELKTALEGLREGDSAEVEPLRAVAFNDTVLERGRAYQVQPLNLQQKILALLA